MRMSGYILGAALVCLAAPSARSMPITTQTGAVDQINLIEKTAVYVVEGHRYCFYFDGWHGPGWYRCGFAFRRGLGWGGVYGWNGWEYGPAARRFGGAGVSVREGRTFREGSSVREGTSVREGSRVRSGATINNRGAMVRENQRTRSPSTTGSGASIRGEGSTTVSPRVGTHIQGGGAGQIQGGGGQAGRGGEGRGGEMR